MTAARGAGRRLGIGAGLIAGAVVLGIAAAAVNPDVHAPLANGKAGPEAAYVVLIVLAVLVGLTGCGLLAAGGRAAIALGRRPRRWRGAP